jgi:hypothetical protein
MTGARLRQRQRILRARTISERIARAEHVAAQAAEADGQALAQRLAHEVALVGTSDGITSGQMLAARAALAERLHNAMGAMAQRREMLAAQEALAAGRSQRARQSRRSAEMLAERGERSAEIDRERRAAVPQRRRSECRP